jgi:hypothetical protein
LIALLVRVIGLLLSIGSVARPLVRQILFKFLRAWNNSKTVHKISQKCEFYNLQLLHITQDPYHPNSQSFHPDPTVCGVVKKIDGSRWGHKM